MDSQAAHPGRSGHLEASIQAFDVAGSSGVPQLEAMAHSMRGQAHVRLGVRSRSCPPHTETQLDTQIQTRRHTDT